MAVIYVSMLLLFNGCSDLEKSREQSVDEMLLFPFNATKPIEAETVQFNAILLYFDGSFENISDVATWNSSQTSVATVEQNGTVKILTTGETLISASYMIDGHQFYQDSLLTVKENLLRSIIITPDAAAVPRGATQNFKATGLFEGGERYIITKLATWNSSDTSVATITKNLLYAKAETNATADINATTTITASLLSKAGAAVLTIDPPVLKEINITYTPTSPTLSDNAVTFEANGTMTDGSSADVTGDVRWGSSDETVMAFDKVLLPNVATLYAAGDVNVTASEKTLFGVKETVHVEVLP